MEALLSGLASHHHHRALSRVPCALQRALQFSILHVTYVSIPISQVILRYMVVCILLGQRYKKL